LMIRPPAPEQLIEHRRELAVAVADQEPELSGAFAEVHEQVAGLPGGPGAGRVGGDAQMCTRRVWISIAKNTCRRLRNEVSAGRKSHARIPDAWAARNCRQAGEVRCGAGVSPAAARIRRMVPAPIRWPRLRSSPWMRRCPHRGFCLAGTEVWRYPAIASSQSVTPTATAASMTRAAIVHHKAEIGRSPDLGPLMCSP
jgi:hypothetical protein